MGARDPYGFKPLCIGKRDNAYILASETCALDTIGAEYVRDVLPGETVTITPENGIVSDMSRALPKEKEARCIFESTCNSHRFPPTSSAGCFLLFPDSSWHHT